MMIDSVIISRALQQTAKLTLPNFGTLLKKDNGEIVFTQFLKNDDMVFTSIIMNSYNVSLQEASQMVSEYVVNLVAKISNGGSFLIPEIGFLYVEANGSIKLRKDEPVTIVQQPRQAVSPRPIIGVSQQPIQQPDRQPQPIPQRQYSQANPQLRSQPPYGPRPQGIPQRPQQRTSSPRPNIPTGRPSNPRPGMRPQMNGHNGIKKKSGSQKTDWFLLVAIVAIVGAIVLIVYALFFAESISDFI